MEYIENKELEEKEIKGIFTEKREDVKMTF